MKSNQAKRSTKTGVKVRVNLKRVKLAELTPAQRRLTKLFWAKLTAEAKKESPPSEAPAKDALTGGTEESSSRE